MNVVMHFSLPVLVFHSFVPSFLLSTASGVNQQRQTLFITSNFHTLIKDFGSYCVDLCHVSFIIKFVLV